MTRQTTSAKLKAAGTSSTRGNSLRPPKNASMLTTTGKNISHSIFRDTWFFFT